MATTTETAYQALPEFLKKVIGKEISLAVDEEIENAKKRIDERKSQLITGVLLHVQKSIEFKTMDQNLIVTVKLD